MKSPEQLKGAIRNIAQKKEIQAAAVLREAIYKTANKRNSTEYLTQYEDVCQLMREDSSYEKRWVAYQRSNSFAKNIMYMDVINTLALIGKRIKV